MRSRLLVLAGLSIVALSEPALAQGRPSATVLQVLTCEYKNPGEPFVTQNQFRVSNNALELIWGPKDPPNLPVIRWAIAKNDDVALVATQASDAGGESPNIYSFTLLLRKQTGEVIIAGNSIGDTTLPREPAHGVCRFSSTK
jgi:hypothetical protein